MRSKVFEPCCANGVAILAGHYECSELHDARRAQAMRIQEGDDVCENLVCLGSDAVGR
jgi:hypothetical protein